jgi:hypothetical protein
VRLYPRHLLSTLDAWALVLKMTDREKLAEWLVRNGKSAPQTGSCCAKLDEMRNRPNEHPQELGDRQWR